MSPYSLHKYLPLDHCVGLCSQRASCLLQVQHPRSSTFILQNVIKRSRQCILFANSTAGYFPCGFSWRAESEELLWELGIPQGIAHSSLSTWHKKPPVPEPPLKEDLFANEVITLMETGPHTGYQNTLPMSYISNPAVIFTIMSLYEDVSVLWCVYIEVRR